MPSSTAAYIDQIIDLWEHIPASEGPRKALPPTPKSDHDIYKSRTTRATGKQHGMEEQMLVVEVVDRSRTPAPPVLQQLQTAFRTPEGDPYFDDASTICSDYSADTRPIVKPLMKSPSYSSLVYANPWDYDESPESPVTRVGREASADRGSHAVSPAIAYSPDDLWMHHRPPPSDARVSAILSPADQTFLREEPRWPPTQIAASPVSQFAPSPRPSQESNKPKAPPDAIYIPPLPSEDQDCQLSRSGTIATVESSLPSATFSTIYEQYDGQPTILTPRPLTQSGVFGPASKTPARPRTSSGHKHNSEDGHVSAKALKMLGITPPKGTQSMPLPKVRSKTARLSRRTSSLNSLAAPKSPRIRSQTSSTHSSNHSRSTSFTWSLSQASSSPSSVISEPPYDPTVDAGAIWKALMENRKPDTEMLSSILVRLSHDPRKLPRLRQRYSDKYMGELSHHAKKLLTGNYRTTICRLIGGPHDSDVSQLNRSDATFFMDDKLVAETLFGRTAEDIKNLKLQFEKQVGVPLKKAIEGLYLANSHANGTAFDVAGPSGAFGRACVRALSADRDVETVERLKMMNGESLLQRESQLMADVEDLYKSDRSGNPRYLNQRLLLELVMTRSDLYLAELCRKFHERYSKELTELVILKDRSQMMTSATYPFNLGYAVAHVLKGAVNKPMRDAKGLEDCLRGLSTNDRRLIARVLRIHFDSDPRHVLFVKDVYHQRYGRALVDRVRKETKGPYRDLLIKLLEGRAEASIETFI